MHWTAEDCDCAGNLDLIVSGGGNLGFTFSLSFIWLADVIVLGGAWTHSVECLLTFEKWDNSWSISLIPSLPRPWFFFFFRSCSSSLSEWPTLSKVRKSLPFQQILKLYGGGVARAYISRHLYFLFFCLIMLYRDSFLFRTSHASERDPRDPRDPLECNCLVLKKSKVRS